MSIRGQSGSVFFLLMMGLSLLSLLGGCFYFFGSATISDRDKAAQEARAAFDEAVAAMEKAMNDPRTIDFSLDRNAAFQCLFNADGNCNGYGGNFLLFESSHDNHPLSHLARDAGSDRFGSACKGYPSKDCPLRVETVWAPVCAGSLCEGTKSIRVKAKVTLAPMAESEPPLEWNKENLFTPQIQLSQATLCTREGGVWAGTECLTPAQIAERQIASPNAARPDDSLQAESQDLRAEGEEPPPMQEVVYECPAQIVVQGQYYPVQYQSADRGQVSVPSMSCQIGGHQDVFVFQCAAKGSSDPNDRNSSSFPNEGQWIQVEAVMSPACDQYGNPMGNGEGQSLPLRF